MQTQSAFKTRPSTAARERDPVELKNAKREQFVLLRGTHDGINEYGERQTYTAGQLVFLTPKQYLAFHDKFSTPEVFQAQKNARKATLEATNKAAQMQADIDEETNKVFEQSQESIAEAAGVPVTFEKPQHGPTSDTSKVAPVSGVPTADNPLGPLPGEAVDLKTATKATGEPAPSKAPDDQGGSGKGGKPDDSGKKT